MAAAVARFGPMAHPERGERGYARAGSNSGGPAVVLEEPAEPPAAHDATSREGQHVRLRFAGLG